MRGYFRYFFTNYESSKDLKGCETQDPTGVCNNVDFAGFILAEGCDTPRCIKQDLILPASVRADQAPDDPRAIITIQVDPIPFGHSAAINAPTSHRAVASAVIVFNHRRYKLRILRRRPLEGMRPL